MDKIILTSNNIFTKDGIQLKIDTKGIDLSEFNDNPIMLFNHEYDKPIGNWESIETTDNDVTAIPNFDEDSLSKTIGEKYSKGSLKSASIGIEVLDAYLDVDDTVVVSKSRLLEASIVSIPANPKAKKVKAGRTEVLTFSQNELLNISDLKNKLKMSKETEPVIEQGCDEDKIETVELAEMPIEEQPIEEVVAPEEVIMESIDELKDVIEKLNSLIKVKEQTISEQANEIETLKLSVSNYVKKEKQSLITDAINLNKINAESTDTFINLSIEELQNIFNSIPSKTASLSVELSRQVVGDVKTYDWYLKNDKEGLKKLAKTNPTLYKQLESQSIKK